MADIRIKDITTTASSAASGDFFVIDGTTGTRKVNAFSPTFGGNATVTGTLTANGTTFSLSTASANGSFINMDGLAGNFKIITTRTGGVDRWYFGQDTAAESGSNAGSPFFIRALTDAGAVIDTPLTITRAAGGRLTTPRPVTISDTTASTTTSSGALVVSGGVGVAKTINVALGITIGTNFIYGIQAKLNSAAGEERTVVFQSAAVNRWSLGVESGFESGSNSGSDFHLVSFNDAGDLIDVPIRLVRSAGGAFTLSRPAIFSSSTASTSTATGALKITGGLGVGGAVNAGTFYGLVDGVTAPATESGYARIYVDSADGDLKVKFGDGTIKTIATDS